MSSATPCSLDILRSSPVRGQLEPYDPRTPKGTRYIQTTDTPNELKILLPPGTASMYEQLLKLENYELSKKPSVSWERIMEIRHLKDRMIRKCQKLAKTTMPIAKTSSRAETFVFQTFVAPSDFRCKEMEKWFREQQKRATSVPRKAIPGGSAADYDLITAGPSIRRISSSSKQPMQRSITNPEPSSKQKQILQYQPLPVIQGSRLVQSERTTSLPAGSSTTPAAPPDVFSPPPLPVLLLSQREDYNLPTLGTAAGQLEVSPTTSPQAPGAPGFSPTPLAPAAPDVSPNPDAAPSTLRPSLSRRSSIGLKRTSVDLKTVSWADSSKVDLDQQFSKYASAARDAQASGKWEEVRLLYLDQIAGLENLHLQVKEGLDHLRSETDHLQRIDETIRRQRGALDVTFHEFEQKQALLQEKVQEALTEANDALSRQGLKRELEPITELPSS